MYTYYCILFLIHFFRHVSSSTISYECCLGTRLNINRTHLFLVYAEATRLSFNRFVPKSKSSEKHEINGNSYGHGGETRSGYQRK